MKKLLILAALVLMSTNEVLPMGPMPANRKWKTIKAKKVTESRAKSIEESKEESKEESTETTNEELGKVEFEEVLPQDKKPARFASLKHRLKIAAYAVGFATIASAAGWYMLDMGDITNRISYIFNNMTGPSMENFTEAATNFTETASNFTEVVPNWADKILDYFHN